MENRIKELEKQITQYNKQIEKSKKNFKKAEEKYYKEIEDICHELWPLKQEYDKIFVEHWFNIAKQGTDLESIKWEEISDDKRISFCLYIDTIKDICSADLYDLCLGCDMNCKMEAKAKFKEIFENL